MFKSTLSSRNSFPNWKNASGCEKWLWKGSLIPPHHAGSTSQPFLPLVYAGFEEFRQSQEALTYDDFIPTASDILENNPTFYHRFCGSLQHLIGDEYFQYEHVFQRCTSFRENDFVRDEPEVVVRDALNTLGKQPFVIPGGVNRLSSFIMRHVLPRKVAIQMMGNILRKMYM